VFRGSFLGRAHIRWCAIAAISFLAGAWIAVLAIPNVPESASLVVHYTTTFGIDALGSWRDLAMLPLSGTVLLLINVVLAWFLTRAEVRGQRLEVGAASAGPSVPDALPHAPAVLMAASAVIEFAVLINAVLLWRANS